jgi:hypothetical protein
VAWFLASYARDALARVEAAGDLPALANVRRALEEALGVRFEAQKGDHFFRSTLVQTLFYGVFSAWVLWAREVPRRSPSFDWRTAVYHLNVPFVRELFRQLADPRTLRALALEEVLDWTGGALNRVEPNAFFRRFDEAEAVQYFYEPFLEAFDPELRKELGVWYTPAEVVSYMVERVDRALREDLGVAEGLASEQVYVLDPCCGTGAYLAAVLRKIDDSLAARGFGALKGQMVKKAATSRVFGFEIMPAPFVVAHLQVGLVLQGLQAPLDADSERAGIFLTNALTGWEPHVTKPLPFPELEEDRRQADAVKQDRPILVILGNPPYNGYAGMAVEEERELSTAYRAVRRVRRPEGQGLNDLYVRFFRMAERRIADKTGQGVVCLISNYSWLDGLSFTGMREKLMEQFGAIRIDCLNGDKYKTGKTTPDGRPDPSIFSTQHNREGIQVGTAIATLVRKARHEPARAVAFRHLWGNAKRAELADTAQSAPDAIYADLVPALELGLPFVNTQVGTGYFDWPRLPDLLPVSFPGATTSRDDFLVDIDRPALEKRIADYFSPSMTDVDLAVRYPQVMKPSGRFNPFATRATLRARGPGAGRIIRYAYRPFDIRWLYWEPDTKLLDEKRTDYLFSRASASPDLILPRAQRKTWSPPLLTSAFSDYNSMDGGASAVPAQTNSEFGGFSPNIPASLLPLLKIDGSGNTRIVFNHCLSILHSPAYFIENGGAMRIEPPRIPLPGEAARLAASAALGADLAVLLDPEQPAPAIATGPLMPLLAVPTVTGAGPLDAQARRIEAGWGSAQKSGAGSIVMPGRGLARERPWTPPEREALAAAAASLGLSADAALALLGETMIDVHLNAAAFWSGIPARVWGYNLGGYQVVKKWLSYREHSVLGRPLTVDEVLYVAQMTRRIAMILLMGPALDANYAASKADAVAWKDGRPA